MEFQKFNKIPRLSREIIITEKIDGTNGQIYILEFDNIYNAFNGNYNSEWLEKHTLKIVDSEDHNNRYYFFAGSRKRWLDTSSNGDNYGFAKWVQANAEELLKLGEGRHYGEYMGKGIQRGYGLDEKRFYLFNVGKWNKYGDEKRLISIDPKTKEERYTKDAPKCCETVPILYQGIFDTLEIKCQLNDLIERGSFIVPGYMNPEGIIIYHTASGQLFKKTIKDDEKPKTL